MKKEYQSLCLFFLRKKSLTFQKFENHAIIFPIGFGLVEKNMGECNTYKKFK
jgi:hypothetical protein